MHTKNPPFPLSSQAALSGKKSYYSGETLRPVVSLIFVAPILLAYELACIGFDQQSMRTGIDQWLHQVLTSVGMGHLVILPIVTAAALLVLHHRRGDNWRIKPTVLLGMSAESIGLGLILYSGASAYHLLVNDVVVSDTLFSIPIRETSNLGWANIFGYFGAGIYEELIFRLLLLPTTIILVARWTGNKTFAIATGLLLISLLFALSHYQILNPAGNLFDLRSFLFRFSASVMFCVVFLFRGFGVAVGTHVAYDVLTQV